MNFDVEPVPIRGGDITVPGDKSVSHRALMLGAVAEGVTSVSGFLAGEDCLATMRALIDLGVVIDRPDPESVIVNGVGADGLREPGGPLNLGNSGTGMRLLAGLLSGQPLTVALTGDASLTQRPMQRIITPLAAMGASIDSHEGRPPLTVRGRRPLRPIDYDLPVASAQVKSAILLAALNADGVTTIREPAVTRDHTERMLRTMGVGVASGASGLAVAGGQRLSGCPITVPGDLSSAAFPILAALIAPEADVLVRNVGVNPTRIGVLEILRVMGASIELENRRSVGEEPVADIRVRSSALTGCEVDPALVSLAIDEFPALFIAAACAQGTTVFSGLEELRVKESDRIATMAEGLKRLGIRVDERDDGAIVQGGRFGNGQVASHGDHRVAMAFAVAATVADGPVRIGNVEAVDTSFPGFAPLLTSLGAQISVSTGGQA